VSNKVTVNIFGQEYTISGDESPEKIVQIASWVDQRMREIDEMVGSKLPTTSLAVLSAINVAKEYFELKKDAKDSLKLAEQRLEDAQRYMNLWDETKKSFQEFQETVGDLKEDKVNLETKLELKEKEIKKIHEQVKIKGYTIVPLDVHLSKGYVKVQIAIAKGKKTYDKRESIAKKDQERNIKRDLKINNR